MRCVMIYDLLLGFLSVILHVMIFIRSRKAARLHQNYLETSIAMRFTPTPSINLRVPNGKLPTFFFFFSSSVFAVIHLHHQLHFPQIL